MYAIDKQAAIEADNHGGFLAETGKYKGHFTRAEKLISKNKGTHGIGFTFEDESKRTTRFDIWTRSGSGDNLMGYKTLQAMMTVMGLRNITPAQGIVDRYDYDTKTTSKVQAEVFNDLVGKPVGLVLRSTEYEKMRDGRLTGETGWRLELVAPFRAAGSAGRQVDLQRRLRKDHGAHVAAIGHQARQLLKTVLQIHQRRAHGGQSRHPRGVHAGFFSANGVGHIVVAQPHAAAF